MSGPYLKCSFPLVCSCWQRINEMVHYLDPQSRIPCPIQHWKICITLPPAKFHVLYHLIMLRCLSDNEVSVQLYEWIWFVISTIIRSRPLYFSTSLNFNYLLPIEKHILVFMSVMHWVYPNSHPNSLRIAIHERHKPISTIQWNCLGRSLSFHVHIIQNYLSLLNCGAKLDFDLLLGNAMLQNYNFQFMLQHVPTSCAISMRYHNYTWHMWSHYNSTNNCVTL